MLNTLRCRTGRGVRIYFGFSWMVTMSFILTTACAAHHGAHHGAHHRPHDGAHHSAHQGEHHFTDPASFVGTWNDPSRDQWQKPQEILAAMEFKANDTVVDLGAGTGYLLPSLSVAAGPQGRVLAVDIEPAMLDFLQKSAEKEGWKNVRTQLAQTSDPMLQASSVDAIVTLNVWHHIDDRKAYAAKLLHALKPGRAFVVVDFLKEQTDGFGPPLEMRLSAEEVSEELRAGGFEVDLISESLPRHYIVRGRRPTER